MSQNTFDDKSAWVHVMAGAISPVWIPWNTLDDKVNIGLGNGLVASSTDQLPELMLTQVYVGIRYQYVTMIQMPCIKTRSVFANDPLSSLGKS